MEHFPGATRADWISWALDLGLAEDLLPVVSRADAKISPDSQLKTLGKVPSRYNAERRAVGIAKWTKIRATGAQIESWSREPDYGICLQSRRVRAFDIDVDHAELAGRLRRIITEHLGLCPVRYRAGSFRVLLGYRVSEPVCKQTLCLPDGGGLLELLGDGQQFVAAGRHPSGSRYEWDFQGLEDFPERSVADLQRCWEALDGAWRVPRGTALRLQGVPLVFDGAHPDPVVDWLVDKGWVLGETGRDGAIGITCPWKGEHTSNSGDSETVYWPAGTGGFEQGHFKCLHAHCAERGDGDFLAAVGYAEADFEVLPRSNHHVEAANLTPAHSTVAANGTIPASWTAIEPGRGLKKGKKGWLATIDNVPRALETEGFWRRLGYDTFRQELMWSEWADVPGMEQWAPLDGPILIEGRRQLERAGFEPVSPELMRHAVEAVAQAHRFDSAQVWLERLTWDDVPRVEGFLATYCGCTASPYATAVSRYLWSALAGRVLQPGVKADMVPILVGAQGQGKTWGIEALAPFPEAYVTLDLSMRDADLARRMRGALLWELNELRGLHTKESSAIKSFVSERYDVWRPAYQEFVVKAPRRGVFVGTSDRLDILDDAAGNRRWLPIEVGVVDRAAIERDRESLWAEAAVLFARHGVVWADAQQLALAEHGQFRIADEAWEAEVELWQTRHSDIYEITLHELMEALGHDPRDSNRAKEMRLGKIMGFLGWRRGRKMINGVRRYVYEKTVK